MPPKKKVEKAPKAASKASADSSATPAPLSAADALISQGIVTTYALNSKKVHRNVRDIMVTNLTVLFHGVPLVEEAELSLNYGNRYGYIGRNGCGKSTFMRVIAARAFPIPEGIDIFHLKEEIEATDMTAKEAVMAVDEERVKLEKEAEELNDFIAAEEGSEEADAAMERLTQVYERLEELDSTTAEARASKILDGLGFTRAKQNKKTREFSGGWRMRIALARALFLQPTCLLLDEPTNHLDMEAVVWLEGYLSNWKKILFLVSHSQDFLNGVCTHIVHHSRRKLTYYSGNYDSFVRTRSEKEEEQEKRYKAEQDQIKHMKTYVARFGQGNAKMARQAQSKEKTLEKMLRSGLTDKVEHERDLDFKFPDPAKLAPPVLQCHEVSFGYAGSDLLYSNVSFGVDLDSRVALVGPNGAGKSTLLKIMTGDLIPVTGAIRPHPHLRISKFSQHFVDVLDLTMSPLDYFQALWPDLTREDGRKFLGRFGISGSVQTQAMQQLSDGQKSRVVLAKMAKEAPHMLFLDEPTNHLDMESIDSLARAINNFEGGMVLVSHDMRLISQVAKEIWLCDNKTVSKFNGDIGDFKMHLRQQAQNNSLEIKKSAVGDEVENPVVPAYTPPIKTVSSSTAKASADDGEDGDGGEGGQEIDEKVVLKAKRKAEKEAAAELQRREEEERQRRKEEKLKDAEDAKALRAIERAQARELEEMKQQILAQREAEEAAIAAEAAAKEEILRQEKEAKKRARKERRRLVEQLEEQVFQYAVYNDHWVQAEQEAFEAALLAFPSSIEKHERWQKIAAAVPGKTKQQCLARYKFLKEFVAASMVKPA